MIKNDVQEFREVFGKEYIELCCALNIIFEDYDRVEEWIFSPNPIFQDNSPISLVVVGRCDYVLKHVCFAINEHIKGDA